MLRQACTAMLMTHTATRQFFSDDVEKVFTSVPLPNKLSSTPTLTSLNAAENTRFNH